MRKIVVGLSILCFLIGSYLNSFAVPVKEDTLPQAFRDAIKQELDIYRLRSIDKRERDGKVTYLVEGRGRMGRTLDITFDEDGKLLNKVYELQLSVRNDRILNEGRPFTIQSFYTPDAGDPSKAPKAMLEAISDLSYSGGNLLAFDLFGLKPDGSGLTEDADKLYQGMIDRLIYTNISCFCKVFGEGVSMDKDFRLKAIRSVAEYFKRENQFIFWIDGPDAESLAKEFKAIASDVMVAAPGADITVVDSLEDSSSDKPVVHILKSIDSIPDNKHFLLTSTKENYATLDELNAEPEENVEWKPDNSALSEDERNDGFVALFDGKTTAGWVPLSRNSKGFVVNDGTLQRVQGSGSIRTVKRFDDFILRFDFVIEKNGNSGVQVRTPRSNRASKVGFEVQILGDYGQATNKNSTGSIYNEVAPTKNASKPAGEWNTMEITCKGADVNVELNGETVQDISLDDYEELKYRLRNGFIILTDHGNAVSYRNIRIKEL